MSFTIEISLPSFIWIYDVFWLLKMNIRWHKNQSAPSESKFLSAQIFFFSWLNEGRNLTLYNDLKRKNQIFLVQILTTNQMIKIPYSAYNQLD